MKGFIKFIEGEVTGDVTNPEDVAKKWAEHQPVGIINYQEVRHLSMQLTNLNLNESIVLKAMKGESVQPRYVYRERLNGSLIKTKDINKRLNKANGVIVSPFDELDTTFGFSPETGDLWAILPGMVYDDVDEENLYGIIVHECQHGLDHAASPLSKQGDMTMDEYVTSAEECRAYHRQFVTLVRNLIVTTGEGSKEVIGVIKQMIRQASEVTIHPKLIPVADAFLDILADRDDILFNPKFELVSRPNPKQFQEAVNVLGKWVSLFNATPYLKKLANKIRK